MFICGSNVLCSTIIADTPGELVGDDDDSEPEYVVST